MVTASGRDAPCPNGRAISGPRAEARVKIVSERLINLRDDRGMTDALQFLMTREITHMNVFSAPLENLGKDKFSIRLVPVEGRGQQVLQRRDRAGELGKDARGPWNQGGEWKFEEAPAFAGLKNGKT